MGHRFVLTMRQTRSSEVYLKSVTLGAAGLG